MIAAIVPTLNEAAFIGPLLQQLLDDAPADLVEILVADGGSQDATRAIVEEAARHDPRIRLLDNPDRIQAAGVNLAADAADPRVSVLVRLDAHAGYPPGYIARVCALLDDTGADSIVVRLRTSGEGCFQKGIAAVSNSRVGTGGAAHRVGGSSRWIDHGHHAAFRRPRFVALGGYDTTFPANEDAEFDVRLRRGGGRIWFAADLEVTYHPRRSPGALARQYFHYGAGRARNLLKHGERPRLRQLAPPLLLVTLVAACAATPATPWAALPPAAYFAATGLVSVGAAIRRRDACMLGISAALPIMHLAWAAGFLLVLVRQTLSSLGAPAGTGAHRPAHRPG